MIRLQRARGKTVITEDAGLMTMWMITEATSGGEGAAAGKANKSLDDMTGGIDCPCTRTRPHVIGHVHEPDTRGSGDAQCPHPIIIVNFHIEGGIDLDRLQGIDIRTSGFTIHPRLIIVIAPHIEEEINLGRLRLDRIEIARDPDLHVELIGDLARGQLVLR